MHRISRANISAEILVCNETLNRKILNLFGLNQASILSKDMQIVGQFILLIQLEASGT